MSKRQRRRVNDRRSVHMQRRTVLPLAVAAVAAPAVAAPAAEASPHVVRLNGRCSPASPSTTPMR